MKLLTNQLVGSWPPPRQACQPHLGAAIRMVVHHGWAEHSGPDRRPARVADKRRRNRNAPEGITVYVRPELGGRDRIQRPTGQPALSRRPGAPVCLASCLPRRQETGGRRHDSRPSVNYTEGAPDTTANSGQGSTLFKRGNQAASVPHTVAAVTASGFERRAARFLATRRARLVLQHRRPSAAVANAWRTPS